MQVAQLRAIEAAKARHGGTLPSDLYLRTNEQLTQMLHSLTGKFTPPRTSKETLIARIERHSGTGVSKGIKKKSGLTEPRPVKQAKRGLLPTLSATQIVEMQGILTASAAETESRCAHSQLMPIWTRIGVKAQYPRRSAKSLVVNRLRTFALNNLQYHDVSLPSSARL
jgi:hypothetical protein